MSSIPQLLPIAVPLNRQEETKNRTPGGDVLLDRRSRHLLSDQEGMFPIGSLNGWEIEVLDTEHARPDSVAWYRNPTRGRDSLGIAYTDKYGDWRTLRPDFIFFTEQNERVLASIVDPHGHWLPDALPKLRGLAQFAATYADSFHRIEAVSKVDARLRVLDFTLPAVRTATLEAVDADELYRSTVATNY